MTVTDTATVSGPKSRAAHPIVQVRDAYRDYPMGQETVHALRGVSIEIARGDYVAIVGPSGCGKSTLLNLLGVVDRPTRGQVLIEGRDTAAMRDREATEFRLRNIGFVFQRFYLMAMLTARENVELPMAEAGVGTAERVARARELLEYVGLKARERHRPGELSGGEQQRVAIARALANRPGMLLADEPTGELDVRTGAEIIDLFRRLNRDGTTVVVVTHDLELAGAARRTIRDARRADRRPAGRRADRCPAGGLGARRHVLTACRPQLPPQAVAIGAPLPRVRDGRVGNDRVAVDWRGNGDAGEGRAAGGWR